MSPPSMTRAPEAPVVVPAADPGVSAVSASAVSAPAVPAPFSHRQVTLEDIAARRKRDGRLVAGTAAIADVDAFKSAPDWRQRPRARRFDHLLSRESAARGPCVLKQAAKHLKKPGMISLGGGLPSPEHFPVESLSVVVSGAKAATVSMGKYDTTAAHGDVWPELDLAIACNYGQAAGSAQLLRFVTEHTELVCQPPYADWSVSLTVGSTGALEQVLRIFCDRERGDCVLTEAYSFSSALETMAPLGLGIVGVAMDAEGLRADALEAVLAGWETGEHSHRPRPHVLYTVPSGQNPTGATQSLARRQALYDVCRRYDVFIIEDEPYYFLQMPAYRGPAGGGEDASASAPAPAAFSPSAFLASLVPTMVSLDVDGRVIRLDSFSKVLMPGSRVGWVTGCAQIVERFQRHSECCNQGPAGIAQATLYMLLETAWGHETYLQWLGQLRDSYTRRRDALLDACVAHLPDVVTWTTPTTGMFLWLKVDYTKHPDQTRTIRDLEEEIFNNSIDNGVLVARGSWFAAEPKKPLDGLFFRTTFAAAQNDAMDEAIRRFGDAVRKTFGM